MRGIRISGLTSFNWAYCLAGHNRTVPSFSFAYYRPLKSWLYPSILLVLCCWELPQRYPAGSCTRSCLFLGDSLIRKTYKLQVPEYSLPNTSGVGEGRVRKPVDFRMNTSPAHLLIQHGRSGLHQTILSALKSSPFSFISSSST